MTRGEIQEEREKNIRIARWEINLETLNIFSSSATASFMYVTQKIKSTFTNKLRLYLMNYLLNIYKFGQLTGSEISQTQPQNVWIYGEEAPKPERILPNTETIEYDIFCMQYEKTQRNVEPNSKV